MVKIEETDKAYVAGLFDGEGCITLCRRNRPKGNWNDLRSIALYLTNTDKAVVEFCQNLFGLGKVYKRKIPVGRGWKTPYQWSVGSALDVETVLELLIPYLKIKQAKAESALKMVRLIQRQDIERRKRLTAFATGLGFYTETEVKERHRIAEEFLAIQSQRQCI